MEKIDIPTVYTEIKQAISLDEHDKILTLSDKILKQDPKEKEAFNCKIIALINLSKLEEVKSLLNKNNQYKDYLLEYAYCLYEKKEYEESLKVLSETKNPPDSLKELVAQNYYKLGKFMESFKIYKEILENKIKKGDQNLDDLITNFLASYVYSNSTEDLKWIRKYMNSWEGFYNISIVYLKSGQFNETLETLNHITSFGKQEDIYNEMKLNYLYLTLFQFYFENYDCSKVSSVFSQYEKLLGNNKYPDLQPYFYNNFLFIKREKENMNEVTKKYDNFLKNDNLTNEERLYLTYNKAVLLAKANKVNEANEIIKKIPENKGDFKLLLLKLFLLSKTEKPENFEEILFSKEYSSHPEAQLYGLQNLLSSVNSKSIDIFHSRLLNFVDTHFKFCLNPSFLSFFIGFYESRHLKQKLSQLLAKFSDPNAFGNNVKLLNLIGAGLTYCGSYEKSCLFYQKILETDSNNKEVKLYLINSLAHVDINKCEELRKKIDETMVDLSQDNISNLLKEVFSRFKKNVDKEKNKKKKKKIRYPKNYDPKNPMPDPERWLPKMQRKKYKNTVKNKRAHQGSLPTDNVKK